jgi:hypothetical protein
VNSQHRWTQDDETACVGAWYAYDGRVPTSTLATLARLIGTTEASVNMKMGNITAVVSGGGLSRAAAATRVTVTRFASMRPTERRDEARAAMDRLRGGGATESVDPADLTDESRARLAAAAERRRDRMKR